MEKSKPTRQDKRSNKRYCSAIDCSNRSARDLDPRTGLNVRFHRFPHPEKDRDMCLKWIANVCRADLSLTNVLHKYICSVHFEPRAYACPGDIGHSSLMPSAVPTLIQFPAPPPSLTPNHPPPPDPPSKKLKHKSSPAVGWVLVDTPNDAELAATPSPPWPRVAAQDSLTLRRLSKRVRQQQQTDSHAINMVLKIKEVQKLYTQYLKPLVLPLAW